MRSIGSGKFQRKISANVAVGDLPQDVRSVVPAQVLAQLRKNAITVGSGTPSSARMPRREGNRFESPQLERPRVPDAHLTPENASSVP